MTVTSTKPPLLTELTWEGGLLFTAQSNGQQWQLDGETRSAASPVQALAAALAGCMSIDIVQILTRGRLPLAAMEARLEAARADEDPRRFTSMRLHLVLTGDIPTDRIERAIALSREKYCSVWHSLRQDLKLVTSFEVNSAPRSCRQTRNRPAARTTAGPRAGPAGSLAKSPAPGTAPRNA